jgi:predicted nucleotidyltransferase
VGISSITGVTRPPLSSGDLLIAEIVRRLVTFYSPERIYLFGSAARGSATPDSDLDFALVLPDSTPAEVRNSKEIYKILWDIDAPIDILAWTRSDFYRRLPARASMPATIVREGKLLYAR